MSTLTKFYDDGRGPIPNIWYPKQPGKWTPSRDFSFFDGLSSIPPEVRDRIFYYLVFTWDETKQYPQTKPEAGEISFARLHDFTKKEFQDSILKDPHVRFHLHMTNSRRFEQNYNRSQARFEHKNGKLDYLKGSELHSIWVLVECLNIIENHGDQSAANIKKELGRAFWRDVVFEFCCFNMASREEYENILYDLDSQTWETEWAYPLSLWPEDHKEQFTYIQHLSLYYQDSIKVDEHGSIHRFCNTCKQLQRLPKLKSLKVWARLGKYKWIINRKKNHWDIEKAWARVIRRLPVRESFEFYLFVDIAPSRFVRRIWCKGNFDYEEERKTKYEWEHLMMPDSLANIKDGEYQGDLYLEQLFAD